MNKKLFTAWSNNSFTHSFNPILQNPFWDNPILNTGRLYITKNTPFKNKTFHSLIQKNPLLIALIQFWEIDFETIQFWIQDNPILKNKPSKNILRAIRTTYERTSIMKKSKSNQGKIMFFVWFFKNIVTHTKSVQSHVQIW